LAAVVAPLVLALVLLAPPATAQQSTMPSPELEALRGEIEQLRQGQAEILKRLEALRKAVEQGGPRRRRDAPFKGADVAIDGAAGRGAPEARLAIVEFSDYQCPFCRRFSANTLPKLLRDYVDTGKLRYVFKDFPIPSIHAAATEAAIAARCAGAQGKYWQMHDRFFEQQKALAKRNWRGHAEALDLDLADFDACMEDAGHKKAVQQSITEGRCIGVTGTPAFFLGAISADGKTVKATEMVRGARPYGAFKQVIDRLLAKQSG
jgi:protein-disulfide isomerase